MINVYKQKMIKIVLAFYGDYLVSSVECTGPWISIEIKFGRSSGSIVGLQCISILKRHALILIWVFMKWVKFKDGLVNQVS